MYLMLYVLFYFTIQNRVLEENVKLNAYWKNQNTPIVFNDQK